VDLIEEDLIAERIAIESYREIVQFVGSSDARTRELLETILAVEISHTQELVAMRTEMLRRDRSGSTSAKLPALAELQCA
jgi:bacterioferritin